MSPDTRLSDRDIWHHLQRYLKKELVAAGSSATTLELVVGSGRMATSLKRKLKLPCTAFGLAAGPEVDLTPKACLDTTIGWNKSRVIRAVWIWVPLYSQVYMHEYLL